MLTHSWTLTPPIISIKRELVGIGPRENVVVVEEARKGVEFSASLGFLSCGRMAVGSCSEIGAGKPLFLVIYATVVVGILFSALFLFSALYSSSPVDSGHWLSSPPVPTAPSSSSSDEGSSIIWSTGTKDFSKPITSIGVNSPPAYNRKVHEPPAQPKNAWTRDIWDAPAAGTKMPALENFRLTKEIAKYRVKDNVIVVTFGNYAFMDFIFTWVKHLTDLNVTNILVGAMDSKLLETLYWKGVPVFDMGSNMKTVDVGWGSRAFHKMGREKVFLINSLLPFGYELLMCDTDMVWLKNPLPYLAQFPEADILTSTDQVIPTVTDDRLEVWKEVSGAYNIGIFHWRPTNASKKLAKEWIDLLLSNDQIWDQSGFNDLLHKQFGPSVGDNGLLYAFDGDLKLGLLPSSIFCSGHTYFVQGMAQQLKLEPYAVHTTFQYAGTPGKRHRLREGLMFYDPPEYFDAPGGFLSFKPRLPKNLLFDGEHNVDSHFSLVNYQIKQVRSALAVALLLNRTLVMPPLWCRLDRLWYGHPGVLPGTLTRQPFLCPMDHVFEVHNMLGELPEAEFGPRIEFREYSFLENPSLPRKVKESWLDVEPCEEKSTSCNTSKAGVIKFPQNSNEEKFVQVFSSYKDVKVIQFSSMQNVFQGFTDKVREDKFRRRVKRYTGIWCCVENRTPGHIYYDMYWDEKPDWKPKPPEKPEDDHPPL